VSMSTSEQLTVSALTDALEAQVAALVSNDMVQGIDERTAQRLVASVIRLYAAAREHGVVTGVQSTDTSTTEALVLVSDVLEAHDINTFDLALWLSHAGRH